MIRTTWYEPPAAQAGSAVCGCAHTYWLFCAVLVVSGWAMPSLKPNQSRATPTGRGGFLKPLMVQRGFRAPLVAALISSSAWASVSLWLAHSWISRSPLDIAGSRSSWRKGSIVTS